MKFSNNPITSVILLKQYPIKYYYSLEAADTIIMRAVLRQPVDGERAALSTVAAGAAAGRASVCRRESVKSAARRRSDSERRNAGSP